MYNKLDNKKLRAHILGRTQVTSMVSVTMIVKESSHVVSSYTKMNRQPGNLNCISLEILCVSWHGCFRDTDCLRRSMV